MLVSLVLHNLSNENQTAALSALNIDAVLRRREFGHERLPSVDVHVDNGPINFHDYRINKFLLVSNETFQPPIPNRCVVINLETLLNRARSYQSFTDYLYQILWTHPLQQTGSPLTTLPPVENEAPNIPPHSL